LVHNSGLRSINNVSAEEAVFIYAEDEFSIIGYVKQDKPLKSITIVEKINGESVMSTYDIVMA
jgi:hypothetical protein